MQGFNRYYPPDYDPNDAHKGNLNRLAGKAPTKPVVRFEMPFDIWCLSCSKHIAQGVRFNAHKKKVGMYYSSPIFAFSMTCHLCSGAIEIVTNPKETRYDITSGARKKAEPEQLDLVAREADPIMRLEIEATRKKVTESGSGISDLIQANKKQWDDPYSASQKLRRKFRGEKTQITRDSEARAKIADRHGLGIEVLAPNSVDRRTAHAVEFRGADVELERRRRRIQKRIMR